MLKNLLQKNFQRSSLTFPIQNHFWSFYFKWQVRKNMVNLIEDDRKVSYFMKVVDKHFEKDVGKVRDGAAEVLKSMQDRKCQSQVRMLLLSVLESKTDNSNQFECMSVRANLVDDYIVSGERESASKELVKLQKDYGQVIMIKDIDPEEVGKFTKTLIMSYIQIGEFAQAEILAQGLYDEFEVSKTAAGVTSNQLFQKALPICSYLWTIYKESNNPIKAQTQFSRIQLLAEACDRKIFWVLNPTELLLFEDFMLDVFKNQITNKEFTKSLETFKFYTTQFYKKPIKELEGVPFFLEELQIYFTYINAASKKFMNYKKIAANDQAIISHSVDMYYKYAIKLNEAVDIDLEFLKVHEQINLIKGKLDKVPYDKTIAAMYSLDSAIRQQIEKDQSQQNEETSNGTPNQKNQQEERDLK